MDISTNVRKKRMMRASQELTEENESDTTTATDHDGTSDSTYSDISTDSDSDSDSADDVTGDDSSSIQSGSSVCTSENSRTSMTDMDLYVEPSCEGCLIAAPGQRSHMGMYGCLESAQDKLTRYRLELDLGFNDNVEDPEESLRNPPTSLE